MKFFKKSNKASRNVNRKNRIRFAVSAKIGDYTSNNTLQNQKFKLYPKEILILPNAINKTNLGCGSFHEAISPALILAQIFGIMPVVNITSTNPLDLFFKWKSGRTFYCICVFISLLLYCILTIYWSVTGKIEFQRLVPIIFYGSNTYIALTFIFLGKSWPNLMKQWNNVEQNLPAYKTLKEKCVLKHRLRLITITIMTLSFTEHILSIIPQIQLPKSCPPSKTPVEDFFRTHLNQLFAITDFAVYKAFIGKIINILATFVWSYMDLFVMLISVGLSSRFRQINESLIKVKGKPVPAKFWGEYRLSYRQLCNLCTTIDNAIAPITMVSFSNNLFFICVQLLNSLNTMPTFAHGLYFWFSIIYLIGRTLAVSLYSADINSESKKPMEIFRSVPQQSWCLEVKRFSEEVSNDTIALSGMRFFYLTRRLVLSVAGTIVTYELVLVQFHEDDKLQTNISNC